MVFKPSSFEAQFQTWDYRIKIECPKCGRCVGAVEKFTWQPERVTDNTSAHGHGVVWPEPEDIARSIKRAMSRPSNLGALYSGRSVRLRAKASDDC